MWHKKFSLYSYPTLGKVACIVCSKILGIGSAERAWGDVKQLKTRKLDSLGGENTKMQATIFGNHCKVKAQISRDAAPSWNESFWDEDDFDNLGLSKCGIKIEEKATAKRQRVFCAWFGDWEREIVKRHSPVVEAKVIEKYGGLQWYDNDEEQILTADTEDMCWPNLTIMAPAGDDDDHGKASYTEQDSRTSMALWPLVQVRSH